jgi:hypothetical protein
VSHDSATFRDFHPEYLSGHRDPTCRRLHFAGSALVLAAVGTAVARRDWRWLLAAPVAGYGLAWIGHFFFEHNKPATFRRPFYSLAGDWVMSKDIVTGRIRL